MAQCDTPFTVESIKKGRVPVPCGKCPNCFARRISGWSFRLMQEDKRSNSSHFITLTYDTEHVPITKNGYMSLSKRDVQLFIKRLRKAQTSKVFNSDGKKRADPIKYYAAGEYGGKTRRPHYHIILFNGELEKIQLCWQLGNVHYGVVSAASVGYTLKYMSKPQKGALHANDDRVPEFSLMSKGIGENYLTPEMVKWHKADDVNRVYATTLDGKKFPCHGITKTVFIMITNVDGLLPWLVIVLVIILLLSNYGDRK